MQPVVIAAIVALPLSFLTAMFMSIYLCKLNEWICFAVQRDNSGNIIEKRTNAIGEIEMFLTETMAHKVPKGGFASEMPIRRQYASEMPIRRVQIYASEMPIRRTIPNEMPTVAERGIFNIANEMPIRSAPKAGDRDRDRESGNPSSPLNRSNSHLPKVGDHAGTPQLRMRQSSARSGRGPPGHQHHTPGHHTPGSGGLGGRRIKPDFGGGAHQKGRRPSGHVNDHSDSQHGLHSRTPSHEESGDDHGVRVDHHEIDLSRPGSQAARSRAPSHLSGAGGLRARMDERKHLGYDQSLHSGRRNHHQHGGHGVHGAHGAHPPNNHHSGARHSTHLHQRQEETDRRTGVYTSSPRDSHSGQHHSEDDSPGGIFRSGSNVELARANVNNSSSPLSPTTGKKRRDGRDNRDTRDIRDAQPTQSAAPEKVIVKDKDGVEHEWVAASLQDKTYWINPITLESRWTLPGTEEDDGGNMFDKRN